MRRAHPNANQALFKTQMVRGRIRDAREAELTVNDQVPALTSHFTENMRTELWRVLKANAENQNTSCS